MLTVKEINEVSFGKAGFSGYKPEDVDRFIDEVAEAFQELENERDDALNRLRGLTEENTALTSKNTELQEKLSVLAQRIEAYRAEEDSIKNAIISAQKLAKQSIQEAQDKAKAIVEEAETHAKQIVENAKMDNYKVVQSYAAQTEGKREELEEMKRQVSAFRTSLMEMYKKHLECIDHIPSFRQKERVETPSMPEPEPVVAVKEASVSAPSEPEQQASTKEQQKQQPEPQEDFPVQRVQTQASQPAPEKNNRPTTRQQVPPPEEEPQITINDRVDYTREQVRPSPAVYDFPEEDDLTEVGIDIRSYTNIPETLQKEKQNHYSTLEFGDGVDLGNRRKKK